MCRVAECSEVNGNSSAHHFGKKSADKKLPKFASPWS